MFYWQQGVDQQSAQALSQQQPNSAASQWDSIALGVSQPQQQWGQVASYDSLGAHANSSAAQTSRYDETSGNQQQVYVQPQSYQHVHPQQHYYGQQQPQYEAYQQAQQVQPVEQKEEHQQHIPLLTSNGSSQKNETRVVAVQSVQNSEDSANDSWGALLNGESAPPKKALTTKKPVHEAAPLKAETLAASRPQPVVATVAAAPRQADSSRVPSETSVPTATRVPTRQESKESTPTVIETTVPKVEERSQGVEEEETSTREEEVGVLACEYRALESSVLSPMSHPIQSSTPNPVDESTKEESQHPAPISTAKKEEKREFAKSIHSNGHHEVEKQKATRGEDVPSTGSEATASPVPPKDRALKGHTRTDSLDSTDNRGRNSVAGRYHIAKESYNSLVNRLGRYRPDLARTPNGTLLRDTASPTTKHSTPKDNTTVSHLRHQPDISAIDGGNDSSLSFDMPTSSRTRTSRIYALGGESFVEEQRRARGERVRPPSAGAPQTQSMYGAIGAGDYSYRLGQDPHAYRVQPPRPSSAYHQGYNAYRSSGRHSATGHPYVNDFYGDSRRPQSSYDAKGYARYQQAGGARFSAYDAYNRAPLPAGVTEFSSSEAEDESLEETRKSNESEDEMRRYNYHKPHPSAYPQQPSYPQHSHQKFGTAADLYYCGVLQLDPTRVHQLLVALPPPPEFGTLKPIEKAAYLFYSYLNHVHFEPVSVFHARFNHTFFGFISQGLNERDALTKVCMEMRDSYNRKRQDKNQKAYEASQRQLFSDDRETPDSRDLIVLDDEGIVTTTTHSRRYPMPNPAEAASNGGSLLKRITRIHKNLQKRFSGSICENPDAETDAESVESHQRDPLKFRVPHAFVRFSACGRVLWVDPDSSVSVIKIDDVRSFAKYPLTQQLVDSALNFKGPLINNRTPPHSLRLFVEKQRADLLASAQASADPTSSDLLDCQLIWMLLELVVQQQGRVTGPDLARLLNEVEAETDPTRLATEALRPSLTDGIRGQSVVDLKAQENFTKYLLGGHLAEGIDYALKEGLYADALILTRRIWANDPKRIANVEKKVLDSRDPAHPVMTLLTVATDQPVPVMVNSDWRRHVAILLANLSTERAMNTVYEFGQALARKEYYAAADFCLVSVALLTGRNVFYPATESLSEAEASHYTVSLLHATQPDDDLSSLNCRFGFSLLDLHATEILDFAFKIASGTSTLDYSRDFQLARLQYAHVLNEFGGFSADSFRYCMEVARSIWNYPHILGGEPLLDLCDLAESVKVMGCAEPGETDWLIGLRAIAESLLNTVPTTASHTHYQEKPLDAPVAEHVEARALVPTQAATVKTEPQESQQQQSHEQPNLATQAENWHSQTEPLQMSPRASISSETSAIQPSTFIPPAQPQQPPVQQQQQRNIYQQQLQQQYHQQSQHHQAERRESNASHSNYSQQGMYGEHLAAVQQQAYAEYSGGYDESQSESQAGESSTEATGSSSQESTPVRQPAPRQQVQMAYNDLPAFPPPSVRAPAPQPNSIPSQQTFPQPPKQEPQQHQKQQTPPQNQGDQNKTGARKSTGWMGRLSSQLGKMIPGPNPMILPDDKDPQIRWDDKLGRYVGGEEDAPAPPPPALPVAASQLNGGGPPTGAGPTGGLAAARSSGGSRYFNAMNDASNNPAVAPPPMATALPPTMAAFTGFIPAPAPESESDASPFSAGDPFSAPSVPDATASAQ